MSSTCDITGLPYAAAAKHANDTIMMHIVLFRWDKQITRNEQRRRRKSQLVLQSCPFCKQKKIGGKGSQFVPDFLEIADNMFIIPQQQIQPNLCYQSCSSAAHTTWIRKLTAATCIIGAGTYKRKKCFSRRRRSWWKMCQDTSRVRTCTVVADGCPQPQGWEPGVVPELLCTSFFRIVRWLRWSQPSHQSSCQRFSRIMWWNWNIAFCAACTMQFLAVPTSLS